MSDMRTKAGATIVAGIVVTFAHDTAKVIIEADGKRREILARRSGLLRLKRIGILPGDLVQVEMTEADSTRGRLVARERAAPR